jgi:putative oxidoreductase
MTISEIAAAIRKAWKERIVMSIGILLLRVVVGLVLAAHGAQKLFGWFGGPGLGAAGAMMEQLGFVPGRRNALAAGLAEFGGGLLLAFGLLTPLAAAALVGLMVVAGVSVHWRHGFFVQNGGYEYPLVLGLAALSLAFTGPGPFSLDALLGLERSGVFSGLAAFVLGVVAGALKLATRRLPTPQTSSPSVPQAA